MCACMSVRVHERVRSSSVHLPLEKRAVMSLTATRTIAASQSRPLVLRPPQLCNSTNQEQQLAQRGEDAGITVRRRGEEEREKRKEMRSGGCSG